MGIASLGTLIFFHFAAASLQENRTAVVEFPRISGPIAVTSGPREHLFASYYGINSWDITQRYVTVLETDLKNRLPTENDPAVLGIVDLYTRSFRPLSETRAWNFQQGCMAHWLGNAPDRKIIYNDLVGDRFVSVILDVFTGEKKIIPYPVSAVSPDGRSAVSINFARLRLTRPDYGYGGEGQDPRAGMVFPEDDGLFLVDLESGKAELLVSIAEVKEQVPDVPETGLEYFNHTLFSRDGSKIFWLARATPERNTTAFTVNTDGSGLRTCFPPGWGGSHFDWLDGNRLMVTAQFEAKSYGHILFTVGKKDYKRLGNGLLDYDGHGTFSPDGRWMVTDTYPSGKLREQKLFLMDMRTEAVLPLGRYVEPAEFRQHGGESRCDLHPRWSPKGNMIGMNSTFTGSRQVYIFRLRFE
jgi:hypothetical protein